MVFSSIDLETLSAQSWVLAPNARPELRLEAAATHERTLEAVSYKPGVRRYCVLTLQPSYAWNSDARLYDPKGTRQRDSLRRDMALKEALKRRAHRFSLRCHKS
jgi:hypothetical protein